MVKTIVVAKVRQDLEKLVKLGNHKAHKHTTLHQVLIQMMIFNPTIAEIQILQIKHNGSGATPLIQTVDGNIAIQNQIPVKLKLFAKVTMIAQMMRLAKKVLLVLSFMCTLMSLHHQIHQFICSLKNSI